MPAGLLYHRRFDDEVSPLPKGPELTERFAGMGHVDHFAYGAVTPGIAYLMSCVGSALGLLCTTRARAVRGWARARWLVLGAASIGGTGIWVMHFIGMLGFSVRETPIRYDVGKTMTSLVLAVVVVGVGMAVAGRRNAGPVGLVIGGVITGGGVAIMHYMGMAAMSLDGSVEYDSFRVGLSILIAVVAATAALWAALNVSGFAATAGAALIMGLAVSGMHYTGMSAMSVRTEGRHGMVHGVEASQFLAPLITGISLFTVITLFIVALSPSADEIKEEDELSARLARLEDNRFGSAATGGPIGTPPSHRRGTENNPRDYFRSGR
ncbi:MHYT domain-containing protein [Embleya sp. NPDC008237]|uniref:MHYT domain-containing protein n=1 Tax=Embleya sp. NPDC008237 TaxID=3363978 RepID=UPI0036E52518